MSLPGKSLRLQRKQQSRNPVAGTMAAGEVLREKGLLPEGETGLGEQEVGEGGLMIILALLTTCELLLAVVLSSTTLSPTISLLLLNPLVAAAAAENGEDFSFGRRKRLGQVYRSREWEKKYYIQGNGL